MRDPRDSTRPPAPGSAAASTNAFSPAFLHLLDAEDDPLTATEAAAEGPWTVVRRAAEGGEPWVVMRQGEHPAAGDRPAAVFAHRQRAVLAAAAVALAGRDATYRLAAEPDATGGHAVLAAGRPVGHLPWFHADLVAALDLLDALVRSPRALAAVLEAAGPTALALAGAELGRRRT